ncbi:uncharacterized protein LOC113508813 isoform X2 [Trichoplusia ni]|uniref:Uncharacterized protein LOC113508813 isoform X2 n=1 Tax=Trichoplusia ni TaxID=7111 RepID=A0A7E5X5B5_TRINI|nr:uncharacterized protein LOC113508813 isoform X2 [Trichoplusia ni]
MSAGYARSFVISLAIAIAITKSPASGFTIGRSHNILSQSPDLDTGESTQLEVRYDLKSAQDSDQNVTAKVKGSDTAVIAINDPKNKDTKIDNDGKIPKVLTIANQIADEELLPSELKKTNLSADTTTTTSTAGTNNSHITTTSSTSQTATKSPEKNEERLTTLQNIVPTGTFNRKESLGNTLNTIQQGNVTSTSADILSKGNSNTTDLSSKDNISTEASLPEQTTNNLLENATVKPTDISTTPSSSTEHIDVTSLTPGNNSHLHNDSTTKQNISNFINIDQNISETKKDEENKTLKSDESTVSTTSRAPETDVTSISQEFTTEWYVTTDDYNTDTASADYVPPALPHWKKYTTIDRKRISTESALTNAPENDMTKAETAQTRISLDKVFIMTPIPSLEKLKNDLINAQESTTVMTTMMMTTQQVEEPNATDVSVTLAPVSGTQAVTQMMAADVEPVTTKQELVSKRAGYIHNVEVSAPKADEITTSELPPKATVNDTEMFGTMYETEPGETDTPENKNITGLESQSQLAEDAIKEELLREETLNDEENAKRYRDERLIVTNVKSLKEWKTTDNVTTGQDAVTEDMLSVQPISPGKKKLAGLYAVSPNYKPLKKLDVQPPKQFVRDPDDNSWRNESISSLGIVFKPKNASKSFTEVLKNKTETEWANMTEKDNKDGVPDLRVRLEKIAEVRKSKKKRVNKFGDTVYSDYEETSGENISTSKVEDVTVPMSPETILSSTTPSPSKPTSEFDLTVNAISKENMNIFKNDLTTPLTTNKPKKFYNLAEYYDTTDEYDADYVNLSKIDLKKFTQPFKATHVSVTQPPELLRTKPMREYQPERKATVQYFPPTQKVTQKVNVNDYDHDFNRKVNLYTFKEPPQNVLSVTYATASPLHTEKNEQLNKLTVKPAFTPMYRPDSLDKNLYLTNPPRVTEPPNGFVVNDGNFNRASYVIKHYRDFINEAAKESDDDRSSEFLPYTRSPLQGVTMNDLAKLTTLKDPNQGDDDYDYETKFRKDILNRFVDNFNQNSERFKVDFPILYNNSVVHRSPAEGKVASSSAFMKRLYDVSNPRPSNILAPAKPCDPHCDNLTVELSPAYELHYYVPEQEEKEEMEPRPITMPQRYRL